MENNNVQERQSNFELLRIISMILIIAHHFSVHGRFIYPNDVISIPRLWIQFFSMGGKIGVNIFVLISGYFLINTRKINFHKVIKLWLQVFFYAVVIYIIMMKTLSYPFDLQDLIENLFPITFQTWWFASAYFILYLLSPFINMFLRGLDKKTYLSFLTILFFIWCVAHTFSTKNLQSNSLLWFIFLYSVAAYIRLWRNEGNSSRWKYKIWTICIALFLFLSVVVLDLIGLQNTAFGTNATYFAGMQTIPTFFISLSIFLDFKNMKIKYNRVLNIIASTTFGVYLIHDHYYLRYHLWVQIFHNPDYGNTLMIIPYSLIVVLITFFACSGIEILRIYFVEKIYMKLIEKIKFSSKKKDENVS